MTDMLSNLLRDIRPHRAVFDRTFMRSPWSLRFEERARLTLVTLLRGEGWIAPDGETPVPIGRCDVAVVVGPVPYTIGDGPDAAPLVVVHGGGLCTTPDGRAIDEREHCCDDGDADGSSVLLKGTYQVEGSVCDRVLRGLPPVLVVRADALPYLSVDMIVAELANPRSGQEAMIDRLLDLLLVSTLREWLDKPDSGAPTWYRAQSDPVVGVALRRMHDDPARSWTVAALAEQAAVSRATLARRFAELVGEPPMSYLACWRLCLAADLLRKTDASVGSVAGQVGYASSYALSVAFKRVYGIRPSEHRRGAEPIAG